MGRFNFSHLQSYTTKFQNNLGVNQSLFGESTSSHLCLHGITALFLDCPLNTCKSNYFLFEMKDNLVKSISFGKDELVGMETTCYGIGASCPKGTFFNESALQCDPCSQGCSACNSLGACSTCTLSTTSTGCLRNIQNNTAYWE